MPDDDLTLPPELREPPPKVRRRTLRGAIARWSGRILLIGLSLAVGVLIADIGRRQFARPAVAPVEPISVESTTSVAAPTETVVEPKPIQPAAPPEQAMWEKGVVTIEVQNPTRSAIGGGFVIENSGLVATNLHVMSDCTEAFARLADGTVYPIAGYIAADPAHDLAIVQLRDPMRQLSGLALADEADPANRTQVWSIGHPHGIEFSTSPGEVSRTVTTSELPTWSQRFVRELTQSAGEAKWIQHTAPISPGNSGGPLVDAMGKVWGVNTWVDNRTRFSYAVHVQHLHALLSRERPPQPISLERYADADARTEAQLWKISAARLRTLVEQGRGMKWQPTNADDYAELQQLAWAVTVAQMPDMLAARGALGDRLESLAKAADHAAAVLRREKWTEPVQVTLVNEQAERELNRPGAGQFLFVTVERVVEGDDGRRGLVAKLAGFERPVFLPLENDLLFVPEPGTQCLVLGINHRGRVVKYGDNPLKPITAPVIISRLILPLDRP